MRKMVEIDIENIEIEKLEDMVRELFIDLDISKCAERFLGTTKHVANGDKHAYREALLLRLRQGGIIAWA